MRPFPMRCVSEIISVCKGLAGAVSGLCPQARLSDATSYRGGGGFCGRPRVRRAAPRRRSGASTPPASAAHHQNHGRRAGSMELQPHLGTGQPRTHLPMQAPPVGPWRPRPGRAPRGASRAPPRPPACPPAHPLPPPRAPSAATARQALAPNDTPYPGNVCNAHVCSQGPACGNRLPTERRPRVRDHWRRGRPRQCLRGRARGPRQRVADVPRQRAAPSRPAGPPAPGQDRTRRCAFTPGKRPQERRSGGGREGRAASGDKFEG